MTFHPVSPHRPDDVYSVAEINGVGAVYYILTVEGRPQYHVEAMSGPVRRIIATNLSWLDAMSFVAQLVEHDLDENPEGA